MCVSVYWPNIFQMFYNGCEILYSNYIVAENSLYQRKAKQQSCSCCRWGSELCLIGSSIFSFLLTSFPDFPGGSDGKASVYNAGDPGSIPELGRSPGEGNSIPL